VEQPKKEEASPSDAHGGESANKKGSQGGKAFKKKIPRVDTWTRKVKVYQNCLEE